MALAFRATGTAKKVASGDMSGVVLGTGHVANDIHVAQILAQDNVTITNAGGWTQKLAVTNGANCQFQIWWKRDNGAESAPTFTHTAGGIAICQISCFSGVDSTLADPFRDIQSQTGSTAGGGVVTVTAPALTGVVAGDMRLYLAGWNDNDTSGAITANWAVVAGWTERQEAGQIGTSWEQTTVIDTLLAVGAAGSVSTDGNGNTVPGTLLWAGVQAALSSAVGGAATVPHLSMGPSTPR